MTPQPLAESGPWQVLHLPGQGGDLVISFASIGHDLSRPPSPEFVRAATAGGRPALFVIDAARSWGTAPGLAQALTAALARLAPPRRILGLGVSMGAFAALWAAEMIPLTSVLAIGPQHCPAAPDEARWRDLTAALPPDLTAPLPLAPQITLLHGMVDDAAQALAFPQRKGVDHLLFPALTHSALAAHLKAQGLMAGLVDAGLAQDRRRLLRLLAQAGGQRRKAASHRTETISSKKS